jgi:ABC-type oligopeptide transport system ATPase subunit
MAMPDSILRVEGLSKHYIIVKNGLGSTIRIDAVNNVSFAVEPLESLGLIGESGSGKTTAASMVLRLLPPSAGRIELFGHDVTNYDERMMRPLRRKLQVVFQHSRAVLDPQMSIGELLAEPLRIHRIVPERRTAEEVVRLMEMVGLRPAEMSKFPSQLSGGQNQRVVIARAIATRPKLVVCDEPVSALDVSVQGQILNLLKRLKKELNLTYLFITHDLKVVRFMCERIAVMHEGRIIETGSTETVLSNPVHRHTRRLISSSLFR